MRKSAVICFNFNNDIGLADIQFIISVLDQTVGFKHFDVADHQ